MLYGEGWLTGAMSDIRERFMFFFFQKELSYLWFRNPADFGCRNLRRDFFLKKMQWNPWNFFCHYGHDALRIIGVQPRNNSISLNI